jgi:porphobilinogen synthase
MADVCLCQYTSTGHCGIIHDDKIDNDSSIDTLAKIAVSQAKAGVDTVSPSAMMDGQVSAIRKALDDEGFTDVSIMSHSAKHRSSFYSPFRDAAECAPKFGDRKTYQVPFTNAREAMMEVETDINEGVDIVMIKPALSYLDLIAETRRRFNVPVAAYSVSGEYALVKGAAAQGWVNEKDITEEILYSIKRAGADMIVTYFAKSAAKFLQES